MNVGDIRLGATITEFDRLVEMVEAAAKPPTLCCRLFRGRITEQEVRYGFMGKAAEKLRAEGMCCQRVSLFVLTRLFDEPAPYYSEQACVRLVCPSGDIHMLLN